MDITMAGNPGDVAASFIDVFAGCGGLSLGLLQAGWKGLFAVEHDRNAFQTLHDNLVAGDGSRPKFDWPAWLPKEAHSASGILAQYEAQLHSLAGQVDLLVGGPPCQGFSSAGRRDPNDPRNKLVHSYLELVGQLRPKLVLIENVRGITKDFDDENAASGRINYAQWIIDELSTSYVVYTRMLDTSTFGVPQKRHRFFVIGVRRDIARSIKGDPFDTVEQYRTGFLRAKGVAAIPVTSRSAISDLEVGRNGTLPSVDSDGFEQIGYVGPITSYQRMMNGGLDRAPPDTRMARHKPEIVARFQKIIEFCEFDGRLNLSLSPELKASLGLKKCAIRVLDPDNPAPTITSMPDDLIHYSEPRALTVRENARLQTFPDWFAFKGKYTTGGELRRKEVPRFTQVANAVPPMVAEAIGVALMRYLARASSAVKVSLPSAQTGSQTQGALA
jgi:DNA (cytosine-5)-methyltransferase 1